MNLKFTYKKISLLFLLLFLVGIYANANAYVVDGDEKLKNEPIKVIVVDPGHGGKDPGAIGPSGTNEKDLTLAISLKLRDELQKRTGAKVLLTRETDRYLTLDERTAYANKYKADIFVSVHINAARRKGANGVEAYFLSFDASDDEARQTAALENDVIRFEGKTEDAPKDDIASILWDLTQTAAHHDSGRLAENVYLSLFDMVGGDFRGVKQAPFIVLVGAMMPAVLVECGFITNPAEERRLNLKKVQVELAASIADGVMEFNSEMKARSGGLARRNEYDKK